MRSLTEQERVVSRKLKNHYTAPKVSVQWRQYFSCGLPISCSPLKVNPGRTTFLHRPRLDADDVLRRLHNAGAAPSAETAEPTVRDMARALVEPSPYPKGSCCAIAGLPAADRRRQAYLDSRI